MNPNELVRITKLGENTLNVTTNGPIEDILSGLDFAVAQAFFLFSPESRNNKVNQKALFEFLEQHCSHVKDIVDHNGGFMVDNA